MSAQQSTAHQGLQGTQASVLQALGPLTTLCFSGRVHSCIRICGKIAFPICVLLIKRNTLGEVRQTVGVIDTTAARGPAARPSSQLLRKHCVSPHPSVFAFD